MKRWVVKAGSTSLDQVTPEDVATPAPGEGEVRVKVHAACLNRRDELLMAGTFQVAASDYVPLSDGAGEIDAVGPGVRDWSVGDRVVGNYFPSWHDGPPKTGQGSGLGSPGQDGMASEYVILKAGRVTRIPASLTFEEAACLPCAALTAWSALRGDRPYRNEVKPGAKVLVLGTGNVSLFATSFARAYGAQVVATTSDDAKVDRMKALGAAEIINYKQVENWGEVAAQRFGGFDHVINAAGSAVLDQALAAAAPGGEIAFMGLYAFAEKPPNLIPLMAKGLSLRGTTVGSALAFGDMLDFIDAHGIKPVIARRFALADLKAAYQAADAGASLGKIVVNVAE